MIKLTHPICPYPKALEDKNYKHKNNKEALKVASKDKCMYCESKISHIDFAHVEHIKPKAAGKYPELEFEWSNLGYACPICNNNKSDEYDESCPFINPYTEDPDEHIMPFGALIYPKKGCERGEYTISVLKLNRLELVEKRLERITDIEIAIKSCNRTRSEKLKQKALVELINEADVSMEYSLIVKAFLKANDII